MTERQRRHWSRRGRREASLQLELFQALMTAIKRLEEAGGETADLREVTNRIADPYREDRR